jgi:hypothetical protein
VAAAPRREPAETLVLRIDLGRVNTRVDLRSILQRAVPSHEEWPLHVGYGCQLMAEDGEVVGTLEVEG